MFMGTSSSSAAICICEVLRPVPSSDLPVKIVTRPFCWTATHESIRFGSTSAGPIAPVAALARGGAERSGVLNATISAPPPFRKSRREWGFSIRFVISCPLYRRLRGALDCPDDAVVGPAAADVAVQGLPDLRLRRARVPPQERDRLHHHAVDAVAALGGLLGDERLQDRLVCLRRAPRASSPSFRRRPRRARCRNGPPPRRRARCRPRTARARSRSAAPGGRARCAGRRAAACPARTRRCGACRSPSTSLPWPFLPLSTTDAGRASPEARERRARRRRDAQNSRPTRWTQGRRTRKNAVSLSRCPRGSTRRGTSPSASGPGARRA